MSCTSNTYTSKIVDVCPDCGEDVDEYGNSVEYCPNSPVLCDECLHAPCVGVCQKYHWDDEDDYSMNKKYLND